MRPTILARSLSLAAIAAGTLAAVAACSDADRAALSPDDASADLAGAPGTHVQYGAPVSLGGGRARTYVILDQKGRGAPLEVGVALDEWALDGLPAHGTGDGPHGNFVAYDLPMPARHGTPYRFVELDWNPAGHGAPHEAAHFDFHFYSVTPAERNAIDPADPQFQAKANALPSAAYVPAPWLAFPAPPNAVAVPRMGVHWIDPNSPELQALLGNPDAYRPFTTTFIFGSWDGKFIFAEPMVTRAFILSRREAATAAARDTVMALSAPQRVAEPGYYPSAYRIAWDARAREYRVALTQLTRRD
jgi:hypothetical protein